MRTIERDVYALRCAGEIGTEHQQKQTHTKITIKQVHAICVDVYFLILHFTCFFIWLVVFFDEVASDPIVRILIAILQLTSVHQLAC